MRPSRRIEIFGKTVDPDKNLADFLAYFPEDPHSDYWVRFCVTNAGGSADVLEFGCGCGNLARPLARAGLKVVALDCNPHAIGYLKSLALRNLVPVLGDFESIALDRQFSIGMLKSCVLNTIGSRSRSLFFETARTCLRSQGVLVVEIYKPRWLERHDAFGNDAQHFSFSPLNERTCRIKAEYFCGATLYELNAITEKLEIDEVRHLALEAGFPSFRERFSLNPLSEILVFA